jgi:DHA2 family multidrug resistance protein-like MFS transporter
MEKRAGMSDGLPPAQRRLAVCALALASAMGTLDVNIANTALPTMARDLAVSPATSIWIINVYQIASVATLFTFAALGGLYGPARIYRIGVLVFIGASLVCALAHHFGLLLAGRVLQGLAASAIFAITPALYREVFPRAQLGRALGINATIVATSTAAGPTLGGFILAIAPWPWIYAINVPFGLANVALNRALPHDDRNEGRLDVPSALASGAGFALLIAGLASFARDGASPGTLAALIAGALAFGWFLRQQTRLEKPMLAVGMFRVPAFSLAGATSFAGFAAQALAYVSLPYFFQRALGATPLHSALLMISWPIMLAFSSPIAGRLSDRLAPGILATIGLGLLCGGLALYATLPAKPSTLAIVIAGAVCGTGFGLFKSPNDRELMMSAPRALTSSASGVLAAVRNSGQAVGAAMVAIVFAAFGASAAGGNADVAISHAGPTALWIAAGCAAIAMLASASRLRLHATAVPA